MEAAKPKGIIAPLRNYITLCKKRINRDLIANKLVGVDIKKELIQKEIINNQRDLKKLQVIGKGYFVTNLIHIGRDQSLPVALQESEDFVLVSPAYKAFLINSNDLIGKFLWLFLKKSEIDRMCSYYAEKDIRGQLSWKDFISLPIFVPELEAQERIVNKYQKVEELIKAKRKVNELLERWMQAYYHVLFDNLIDYTIKSFGELFTIIRGGRPPRGNKEQDERYFCKKGGIPWLQVKDISKKNYKFVNATSEQLTENGFRKGNCHMASPQDLIFIHNASSLQSGKVYVNSIYLTINPSLWAFSNNLTGGGGVKIASL